jgi:protocatechuate 3,4-dioxygenase, alpha subunit
VSAPQSAPVPPAPAGHPLLRTTPSQTVGPYLAIGLSWPDGPQVVPEGTPAAFWLRGRVLDGDGEVVVDALVETWQADPDGCFAHPDDPRPTTGRSPVPGFRAFGRSETVGGEFAILTVKPGPVPDGDGGQQAPHLDVSVFARGLLDRLVTRVYFGDEDQANAHDAVLAGLDEPARSTLVARRDGDGYRFDIHLQGEHETVFFAV